MRSVAGGPGAIGILDSSGYLKFRRPAVGASAHHQVQRGVLDGIGKSSHRVLNAVIVVA